MALPRSPGYIINRIIVYVSAVVVTLVCVLPYLWLVISALSQEKDLYQRPRTTWLPSDPTFDRVMALLTGGESDATTIVIGPSMSRAAREFLAAFWNSLVVASTTTAAAILIGLFAAYAFSRFRFPGRSVLFGAVMVTRMLPPISLAIPLYVMMVGLGLMDNKLALIITYNFFLLPVVIWIMSNYFDSIPKELEEAARVDGCSYLGILFRIILPISKPVIATVAIIAFLMAWDEFFFALLFTQTSASKTLPKAISEFSTQFGGMDYGMVATGGMLASMIPVVIALVLQKYIVSGLTGGAVKG
jgi:ABC-type sugar transport system, permease component